jgi:hypothetical protein
MTKARKFFYGAAAIAAFLAGGTTAPAQTPAAGPASASVRPTQAEASADEKALGVIRRARQTIGKGVKPEEVRGYVARWQARKVLAAGQDGAAGRDAQPRQYESEITLEVMLPDKMRWHEQSDFTSNQSVTTEVLDGDRAETRSETIIDGKPVSLDVGEKEAPSRTAARMKSRLNSQVLQTLLVPTPLISSPFTYVGEAESKDGKADVIGAGTAGGVALRLFFDKQSGLLLLVSYVNKEGKELQKIFLSDYRVEDKLLVAHHVTVEAGGQVVEERELKSLKVNPTFNGSEFKVK